MATRWQRDGQKLSSKKLKCWKQKHTKKVQKPVLETLSTGARLQEATKCSKSSHLALWKNSFLASYCKHITAWFLQGIWQKIPHHNVSPTQRSTTHMYMHKYTFAFFVFVLFYVIQVKHQKIWLLFWNNDCLCCCCKCNQSGIHTKTWIRFIFTHS